MKKSGVLLNNLKENVARIDAVRNSINALDKKQELTKEEQRELESLYRKEFKLFMDNSSIYDDLLEELKTEDDFTKKYISQEANKFLKVGQIDV